ncbi:GNAT family protein [Actinosynnema sp. NPDC020468]|uniref:GNAT family N-acetyltransferase n=1 Tax=Actinosynnema sp. NPDC020468 TaxID=3154488 RepID=UPI003407DC27
MTSMWAGDRVRLRAVEPEDWETFRSFDEHTEDVRAGDLVRLPRSAAGYRAWTEAQARNESEDELFLAVEELAGGALVGSVSTQAVDRRAGRFRCGIAIGREHRRLGYASEAVVLLMRFMFSERRFHKCGVGVYGFNEPSIALHESLGFRVEGRLRDHEFFGGRHHDVVLLGLTVDEFAARHPFDDVRPPEPVVREA